MRVRGYCAAYALAAVGALAVLASVSEGGGGVGSVGEEVDPGPPPPSPHGLKKVKRAGRKVSDDAVLQVREWLVKMKENKGDAAVQAQGCEKLADIVAGSDEALRELAAKGVSRIVAGMHAHPGDEQLQEACCWVRSQLRALSSPTAPLGCAACVVH